MTNPTIRANHRDEIYRFYFSEFSSTLKRIGFRGKIPTLLDFRVEMLRWGVIDLVHNVNLMSTQFIELDYKKIAEDPDAYKDEMLKQMADSKPFMDNLKNTVKRLLFAGVLG